MYEKRNLTYVLYVCMPEFNVLTMNEPENKYKIQVNAIAKLLELIDGVNRDLEAGKSLGNKQLIKQYEHLKKDYTQQLLALFEEYQLPIHLDEAA